MSEHRYTTPEGRIFVIRDGCVYGADAEVAIWVNAKLGGGLVEIPFVAIGGLKPGVAPETVTELSLPNQLALGAYFFNHMDGDGYSDMCVSVAVDDPKAVNRKLVRAMLAYPFEQKRLRRLTAEIDMANHGAVSQAMSIGFRLEGRKRAMSPSGDVGIFGLLPNECPMWSDAA